MPKCTGKRIICSAAAALITAAASAGICFYKAPADINARATVYFTDLDSDNQLTTVTRTVSGLRKTVSSKEFISQVSVETGMSVDELLSIITVERITGAEGADIIVSDMKRPQDAPIVLGALVNSLERYEDVPQFRVISYCDVDTAPDFPYINLAVGTGLAAGLVMFLLQPYMRRDAFEYYRAEKAEAETERYFESLYTHEMLKSVMERVRDLGTVTNKAPDGLEKSGHYAAAAALIGSASGSHAVIAVSPAHEYDRLEEIPFDTRLTAYLACAAAAQGTRTLIVECSLKKPYIGKMFGKPGIGGLSEVAAGNCALWDCLISDARPGVDIITESKSYPAPMAVFASGSFENIVSYLSTQYELILLHTRKAWSCEEWRIIRPCCTGVLLAAYEDHNPDTSACQGIAGDIYGNISICHVSDKTDDDEKKDDTKG